MGSAAPLYISSTSRSRARPPMVNTFRTISAPPSKGLPDTEVQAAPAIPWTTVDNHSDVYTYRPYRCIITNSGTHCIAQIVQMIGEGATKDITGIEKGHPTKSPSDREAQFHTPHQEAVAAQGVILGIQGAQAVQPKAAHAARAAGEKAYIEGDRLGAAIGLDVAQLQSGGEDDLPPQRLVMPRFQQQLDKTGIGQKRSAGIIKLATQHHTAGGIQRVIAGIPLQFGKLVDEEVILGSRRPRFCGEDRRVNIAKFIQADVKAGRTAQRGRKYVPHTRYATDTEQTKGLLGVRRTE